MLEIAAVTKFMKENDATQIGVNHIGAVWNSIICRLCLSCSLLSTVSGYSLTSYALQVMTGSQANPAHYVQCSHLSASGLKQAIQLCILEELPPSSRAASISSIAPMILASPVAQYSRCSCTSLRVFFLPTDSSESDVILFISAQSFLNSCTSKEGKGREGKGREGKGREGKRREGKGREEKGREGKGREGKPCPICVEAVRGLWMITKTATCNSSCEVNQHLHVDTYAHKIACNT